MGYGYYALVVSLIFAIATVEADEPLAHQCRSSGTEPSPSFKLHLNQLMRKFQSNLPDVHYYQDQVSGPGNDNVYSFILCRGDTNIPECKSCVSNAVTELTKQCGDKREGAIWYDWCMINTLIVPSLERLITQMIFIYGTLKR
ncbi:hypothetical protein M5689_018808 [Euphorbia peplus]|nr:hypothetical protein M5689_018808 [Euphorbia peplus]